MGRTLFIKWKDQGIVSFKQVLKEGTLKSFSELKSEFDIDNKDFYKYLQLRHLINNLLAKGHISLELSKLEIILENTLILKGKISEIYAVLRDQAESALTSLKSVWQKDICCNLDDDQWDVVFKCVFFSFSSNKIIEQNYKFIQRIYLTPVRLSKILAHLLCATDFFELREQNTFFGTAKN